jgi:hypothetical protein
MTALRKIPILLFSMTQKEAVHTIEERYRATKFPTHAALCVISLTLRKKVHASKKRDPRADHPTSGTTRRRCAKYSHVIAKPYGRLSSRACISVPLKPS